MHGMPYQLLRLIVIVWAVLSVVLSIVICRNFYASNVFLNLRDVVSCQSTDLSFLSAVFFNIVYLLLINLYYYYYFPVRDIYLGM